jgi:FlaA1/EpsC-like NDP-sugar epimerase
MYLPLSKTPRWIIITIDTIMSLLSLLIAFIIRFDFTITKVLNEIEIVGIYSLVLYILLKQITLLFFKTHQSIIRYTSLQYIKKLFLGLFISMLLGCSFNLILSNINRIHLLPTSIILMDFFIGFSFLISYRFAIKVFHIEMSKKDNKIEEKENVIIYGAGVSGLITKRTLEKDFRTKYQIKYFVDDSEKLNNTILQGTKIYSSNKLEYLIKKNEIKHLIIAIQKPDYDMQQKIIDICIKNSVNILKVPSSKSWVNGDFTTSQIKNIKIEDLLGRNPIYLNPEKISTDLKSKVILVTGAAGSIGSGIVKQLINYSPKKIILLDQGESQLYDLEQELNQTGTNALFEIVIGDVSNLIRMRRLFDFYKPEYVYHAAAYKHVPLMEENPSEAIYTNVLGTKNLVDLSIEYKVKKFVLISTDKAVNPTNVMGASKRIAEIYTQNSSNSETKFITTRFGNVLGSNGSVIPLFKKQIEQGGPITITDKRVTRFFMTIPEACQLVLEAGTMGQGGEIFVFDMGESVKIIDLARKMIKLSGLEEGKDIEIKVTGLRPGEKLYEELLAKEENTISTHHPKILKARVRDNQDDSKEKIQRLIELFDNQNNKEIVKLMKIIVPEYISNNSEFTELDANK